MFPSFRVTMTRCAVDGPAPARTERRRDELTSDGGDFKETLAWEAKRI